MIRRRRRLHRVFPLLGLALVTGACTDSQVGTPTSAAPPTSPSTLPPITAAPPPSSTTTSFTVPPPSSTDPPTALVAEIEDLIESAEEIRALRFLVEPEIVALGRPEFESRVGELMAAPDEELRLEAFTLFYRLVGMLDGDDDLGSLRRRLQGLPESAWYDATTGNLLVVDRPPGLGPLERSEIVHEIVHALADQHHHWSRARGQLLADGAHDRLVALDALIEGDATYFQVVYIQQLPDVEQQEIATAFLEPSAGAVDAPEWLLEDLAFSFDAGFEFVAGLVSGGGIAAVDRAYLDPPLTTEQVLHPARYRLGQMPRAVDPVAASIDGYTELPAAAFGEWALRLLLQPALSPGVLTQTVDGWGGDSYRIYMTSGGEVALGLTYLGDAQPHTAEVTQAFIDFAEDVLGLGEAARRGGGQVYRRNDRPWVFLDREGPGLVVVISSNPGAGAALADQLAPPR